tara:strand:+ start:1299 stop:1553 length:255 start_codon:yes stop_codon:yes gene_type:complete
MKQAIGITSGDHLDVENKWTISVEMSFPIEQFDFAQIFDDDTELDYMYRTWERFRPVLESLISEGKITSYRVKEVPHRLYVNKH